MTREVRRNEWSRFCKKFNATNQFRRVAVSLSGKGDAIDHQIVDQPFFGLMLEKNKRRIDGFRLVVGKPDAGEITEPLISVKQPEKVMVEKNKKGEVSRLKVKTRDGRELKLEISETMAEMSQEEFVAKLAYSLFERRGHQNGSDLDDWLKAERMVQETRRSYTQ